MYPVKLDIPYQQKASRLELLIRIPYYLSWVIVIKLLGILALLVLLAQVVHILILGRRNRLLFNLYYAFIQLDIRLTGYFNFLVDERPPKLGREGIIGTLALQLRGSPPQSPGTDEGESSANPQ